MLCTPIDWSTTGFPVHHNLLEFLLKFMAIELVMLSNHLILCHPFSICLQSFAASESFQWVGSLHQMAKILELKHQSFQWIFGVDFLQDWLLWSPCCARDSQESFLAPQFKSINSLGFNLLYGPTLTSIHDYRKNHSFDHIDLCQQIDVSTFEYAV